MVPRWRKESATEGGRVATSEQPRRTWGWRRRVGATVTSEQPRKAWGGREGPPRGRGVDGPRPLGAEGAHRVAVANLRRLCTCRPTACWPHAPSPWRNAFVAQYTDAFREQDERHPRSQLWPRHRLPESAERRLSKPAVIRTRSRVRSVTNIDTSEDTIYLVIDAH